MSFWNRPHYPHPLVVYLGWRIVALCAFSLYLTAFYELPWEAYLFFGLVFVVCTSAGGIPWSLKVSEQLIEVKGVSSESAGAPQFSLPIHVPVLTGLFCVVAAAVLTAVESMQIVSDPWLRQVHGVLLATVGVLLMAFRHGGYVDTEGRRGLVRWFSLFGIRFPTRRLLKSEDQLVLYRLLTPFRNENRSSVESSTRLCLVGSGGAWTFLRGAKASDANAVAASLGLDSFVCHTDDVSDGLAEKLDQMAVNVDEPSYLRAGAPAPPTNGLRAALALGAALFLIGPLIWAMMPIPQNPQATPSPNPSALAQAAKKSASQELVDKGVELYLETVEKTLSPAQQKQTLEQAVASFEQAAKLGAKDTEFYAKTLFALQRHDEGLAVMAKSDEAGHSREQLAQQLRADGNYEVALKCVDSALTARAPCERLILRANLLLDLGRKEDGLHQVNGLETCRDSPSFSELTRRLESL